MEYIENVKLCWCVSDNTNENVAYHKHYLYYKYISKQMTERRRARPVQQGMRLGRSRENIYIQLNSKYQETWAKVTQYELEYLSGLTRMVFATKRELFLKAKANRTANWGRLMCSRNKTSYLISNVIAIGYIELVIVVATILMMIMIIIMIIIAYCLLLCCLS